MGEQLFYEDVQVGQELPPLAKHPDRVQLVKYAGASGDYHMIHYWDDHARQRGFPGAIVHGLLKAGFLGQLITSWAGPGAWVQKFETRYRRIDEPGNPMTCRGRVTNKYVKEGKGLVELEFWTENAKGEVTTPGTATVVLPSRG